MAEGTHQDHSAGISERVYDIALRGTAALIVLLIFAGLAYLVGMNRLEGGALLLYAGVLLGYILSALWHRQ